ncbi:4-hydroxythreonine-4-phosphate dehydrogenase [hydrothermal vent metagenome]|uniref:4-hydroxythreonine-4-phosphate dehydrogenase n=1 Tax=hydrothermal vent metagenome TaxID=652676 RepID=A0A3B0W201_9ZZZZ
MSKPIAITLGEPAGIGVELVTKLAIDKQLENCVIIGDKTLLEQHINKFALPLVINRKQKNQQRINCLHIPLKQPVQLGQLNIHNSSYVLAMLDYAANGCISGKYAAMVTCPLHKGVINDSGINFSGHTEYLAALSNTNKVVMMLLNQYMRVALVTTHIPLQNVASNITIENLTTTIDIVILDMQSKFGIAQPRIAVCGLNPHAGEDGHLGMEEIEIINPVIQQFQQNGFKVYGSIPADTLFTTSKLKNYDVVIAMYHDQGLAPLKYAGFGQSVNLTLGLPFIRTSVDHGTALDIAGRNIASADSLLAAIKLTREIVQHAG